MREEIKQKIKIEITKSITRFFSGKDVSTKHILDLIFPVERRIRSLMGGLETSLGSTVWEPIAKTLALENGFSVINQNILQPSPYPTELANLVGYLHSLRLDRSTWIPSSICRDRIRKLVGTLDRSKLSYVAPPSGLGVDIWVEKNGKEYVFDSKTTQPNRGDFGKYDGQILNWYASRIIKDPSVDIEAKIAFPFNPYEKDFWATTRSKAYPPLEPGIDALVENEYWDLLSGQTNTWQDIYSIFIELGEEDFGSKFYPIFRKSKR